MRQLKAQELKSNRIQSKCIILLVFQMAQLCLIRNPKDRASVADILAFPFEMVIPIEK